MQAGDRSLKDLLLFEVYSIAREVREPLPTVSRQAGDRLDSDHLRICYCLMFRV